MNQDPKPTTTLEELAFEACMTTNIVTSIDRLRTFATMGGPGMAKFLAHEALILLDKIHVTYPQEFGAAFADHRLMDLKVGRGFCGNQSCFNSLVSPVDWPLDEPQIHPYLDRECVRCARFASAEMADEVSELINDYVTEGD